MTRPGSRYSEVARRTRVADLGDGELHPVLPIRFLPSARGFFEHTVVEGDRLDLLAAHYYERPDRFWVIADANPAVDPETLLVPGNRIVVPPDMAG